MKKYKFLAFIILLIFTPLCIYGGGGSGNSGGEPEYSLAAEPSLVGAWSGSVNEILGDKQGQLTIVITSDTEPLMPGYHDIAGTVTLSGFPLCFTQGLFSSETGVGYWNEGGYGGAIIAIGEGFSKAALTLHISSDLKQIQIVGGGGSGFLTQTATFVLYWIVH